MARILLDGIYTSNTQGGVEVHAEVSGDVLTHPWTFPTMAKAEAFATRVLLAGDVDPALWMSRAEEADRLLQARVA